MNLTVSYDGKPNEELDKWAIEYFESIGFKWYAQGYDIETNVRDIAFSKEKKENK